MTYILLATLRFLDTFSMLAYLEIAWMKGWECEFLLVVE